MCPVHESDLCVLLVSPAFEFYLCIASCCHTSCCQKVSFSACFSVHNPLLVLLSVLSACHFSATLSLFKQVAVATASDRYNWSCYYADWFALRPESHFRLGIGQQTSNRDWDSILGLVGVTSCVTVSVLHAALSILACSTWLRCTSSPGHGVQYQRQLQAPRRLCCMFSHQSASITN